MGGPADGCFWDEKLEGECDGYFTTTQLEGGIDGEPCLASCWLVYFSCAQINPWCGDEIDGFDAYVRCVHEVAPHSTTSTHTIP